MTKTPEPTTAPEAHQEPGAAPEPPTGIIDAPEPTEGTEAAKYRRRLRQAEAQRDGLSARVEHLQRAEVERLVTGRLANPTDTWLLAGDDLAQFCDDDGNIDPELVDAFVVATVADRPSWEAQHVPQVRSGPRGAAKPAEPSWRDVLRG